MTMTFFGVHNGHLLKSGTLFEIPCMMMIAKSAIHSSLHFFCNISDQRIFSEI